jgi:hypothetical protein
MYQYNYSKDFINLHVFEFKDKVQKNEFEKFKEDFDKLLTLNSEFYAVFNLLDIKDFDIKFFYKKMDYIYSNKEIVKKLLQASSIVIKNSYGSLIKLGLKIRKPLSPNLVCDNMGLGVQFLIDDYQKNNDLKVN